MCFLMTCLAVSLCSFSLCWLIYFLCVGQASCRTLYSKHVSIPQVVASTE